MYREFPDAVLGPVRCLYRGGTGVFPRVRNTGELVLRPTSLVFTSLIGRRVTVDRADIVGTRVQRTFNTHWNGKRVLVVETENGDFGLTVRDLPTWRAALDTRPRDGRPRSTDQ